MASPFITLRPGDLVEVIAPASACPPERLDAGLRALREAGYVPRLPPRLFGPGYIYADHDSARWEQLRRALLRPDSRAVWCVRGGYGSARLLPRLARMRRRPSPKTLIGFSDLTALLNYAVQRWGWVPLHGPVLSQLGGSRLAPAARAELLGILAGRITRLDFEDLEPLNAAARAPSELSGTLVGGNLKTLQSLLGTPWAVRARDRILMLEDTGERAYAVDRMLVQLGQSGALRHARAVVFGAFTGGDEPHGGNRHQEVLAAFAGSRDCPVLAGLPVGHQPGARAVPLGAEARLELGPRARLSLAWPAG